MNDIDRIVAWVSARLDEKEKYNHELHSRIEDSAWNLRATYAEREFNKTGKFPKACIQNLGKIDLEEVDVAEMCDYEDGCTIWRSVEEIPRPIQIRRDDKFEYVGSPNRARRFTLGSLAQIANYNVLKFKPIVPNYAYEDNRVYADVEIMTIKGMFEDPRQAIKFNHCEDSDCDASINSFMPADWVESIKMEIVKEFSPYIDKQVVQDITASGNEV